MSTKYFGNLGVTLLALINIGLWLIFPPPAKGELFGYRMLSEMCSSTAMVLMTCGLVLSLRPRFLEPYFGGLDKMYQTHKTLALTAIGLLFCHFLLMPLTTQTPWGNRLGMLALWGFVTLILISLAPRLPVIGGYVRLAYHQWKLTHKFIGLFYIVGIVHATTVNTVLYDAPITSWYWKIMTWIGATAYLYKEIIAPFVSQGYAFVVEAVRKLNSSTLEVTLKPHGPKPAQTAGQFMFVRFPADKVLAESHPFTISSAPHEPHLRLSIKASGDWTKHLYQNLQVGAPARIEGCYGQLNYKTGGPRQIWIAGGIGITPFLSWVRDLHSEPTHEIDFFYTARAESDALFWEEFQTAAQNYKNFRATLNVSARDGSLSLDKIKAAIASPLTERHIYMCGPLPMIEAFDQQFRAAGVSAGQIHFEEFNFR